MLDVSEIKDLFDLYLPDALAFGLKVVLALVILIVGRLLIKLLLKIIDKILTKSKIEISVIKFLKSLVKALLYIILFIIISTQLGIPTASFIAVLGSAGLAIGLALQGSLANFAGGILILIIKPFKIGDYIVDGETKREGTVNKIDLFYTTLTTVDNTNITIPNGKLANSDITNYSVHDKRRLFLEFAISYKADIDKTKDVVHKIISNIEEVINEEEIVVLVKNLSESGILMELRVWVKTQDYWDVKFKLLEKIKKEFDQKNIEIPFNQLEIHISNGEV